MEDKSCTDIFGIKMEHGASEKNTTDWNGGITKLEYFVRLSQNNVFEIRIEMNCTRCSLHKTRRNIVVGRGNAKTARWVFLGEGPGKTEDLLGKAFIGQAGQLQDELIVKSGGRVEDCYFTNIVLCHPTDQLAGENREPTADEVLMCSVNVCKLINEINPERVIFVGRLAEKYYAEEYGHIGLCIYHTGAMLRSGRKTSDYWKISLNRLKGVFNG